MKAFWTRAILAPLYELGQHALASLSNLIGMLVLILFGLILGWIAKEILYRVLRALRFDRLCDRLGVGQVVERTGMGHSSSYLAGQLVQGLIILVTLLAGLNELGTPLSRNLVDQFFLYLPHLLAAFLVLIGGALVSRFLGRSVLIAAVNAQMPSARLLSGLSRFFVMALTVVAALDELGISRITIIVTFAIVLEGSSLPPRSRWAWARGSLARDLLQSQFRPKARPEAEDPLRHL